MKIPQNLKDLRTGSIGATPMINHTPTPWKSYEGYDATVIRTTQYELGEFTPRAVAEVTHHGEFHKQNGERTAYSQATAEDRANAAFILRACNAHDDLVIAVQVLMIQARKIPHSESQAAAMETALSALRLASGEK